MRIWCSCGAAIRARRSDCLRWQAEHRCPDRPAEGDTHIGTGAQVEHAGQRWYDGENPIIQARTGFQRNPQ